MRLTNQFLLVGATILAQSAFPQDNEIEANLRIQDDVELTPRHVAGNVHMIQRPGGASNVGVFVGAEGILLVDSLFEPMADELLAAIRKISDGEIRFLLNTHVHIDHIGGNGPLAAQDVLVLAHDNVRVRSLERLRAPRMDGRFRPPPSEEARPFLTFKEEMVFYYNEEEVRAFLAPPAHTDGDTFVYFPESNVLHLGDVFRTTSYPIIDVYNGGTLQGTIEALEFAIEIAGPGTRVIPGHGLDPVGRDAMIEFLYMINDVRTRVLSMIADGMSLAEVMAGRPTAQYDAKWGQEETWTANDFVPIVYYELGGGSKYRP